MGCGGGLEDKVVGKYRAKMNSQESGKDDVVSKMGEGLADAMISSMTMEIKEDKTFSMSVMGFPMKGTWTLSGTTLTLTMEEAMGVGVKETEAKEGKGKSANEPVLLSVSSDGKTLTPTEKKKGEPDIVFVREEAASK